MNRCRFPQKRAKVVEGMENEGRGRRIPNRENCVSRRGFSVRGILKILRFRNHGTFFGKGVCHGHFAPTFAHGKNLVNGFAALTVSHSVIIIIMKPQEGDEPCGRLGGAS